MKGGMEKALPLLEILAIEVSFRFFLLVLPREIDAFGVLARCFRFRSYSDAFRRRRYLIILTLLERASTVFVGFGNYVMSRSSFAPSLICILRSTSTSDLCFVITKFHSIVLQSVFRLLLLLFCHLFIFAYFPSYCPYLAFRYAGATTFLCHGSLTTLMLKCSYHFNTSTFHYFVISRLFSQDIRGRARNFRRMENSPK